MDLESNTVPYCMLMYGTVLWNLMLSFPFTSELKGFGIEINMHIALVPKGSTVEFPQLPGERLNRFNNLRTKIKESESKI